jgi:hypothetical protein
MMLDIVAEEWRRQFGLELIASIQYEDGKGCAVFDADWTSPVVAREICDKLRRRRGTVFAGVHRDSESGRRVLEWSWDA